MAYELRDNSGSLFKNDKKQQGDNKPNYTGRVMVNGVEMWISAWLKDGANGKFMSLSFKPIESPAAQQSNSRPPSPPPVGGGVNIESDDIPF